jgi:hypothetical protein
MGLNSNTPSPLRGTPPAKRPKERNIFSPSSAVALAKADGGVPRRGEGVFVTHSNGTPT